MLRKYDLLAISLLIFGAILLVWLGLFGPTNTSNWKDWQPLKAAVLALGGAGIVYRGAALAYRAAMAKVELDRETQRQELRRRQRGILMRLHLAAFVMLHDAKHLETDKVRQPVYPKAEATLDPAEIRLRTEAAIEEAWANLDVFPSEIAKSISMLKVQLFNVSDALERMGPAKVKLTSVMLPNKAITDLANALGNIHIICEGIQRATEKEFMGKD
jgi:hypothetical protein